MSFTELFKRFPNGGTMMGEDGIQYAWAPATVHPDSEWAASLPKLPGSGVLPESSSVELGTFNNVTFLCDRPRHKRCG
jgi:hypothetical protein